MTEDDGVPEQVLRAHPELARLVELCREHPEAQAALAEFLRSCQGLSREEIADLFEHVAAELERMVN